LILTQKSNFTSESLAIWQKVEWNF
jgi:hypothetical protein